MPEIIVDPESHALTERFAVVRVTRKQRARFAEGCVTLVDSETAARAVANPGKSFPAIVYGPSISSEGQRLYYLARWL